VAVTLLAARPFLIGSVEIDVEPEAIAAMPELPSATLPVASSRPVAAGEMVLPPAEAGRLERVEPRAPLGELAQPVVRKRDPRTLLFKPVATAAGRIESGGVTVSLAGIGIVEPDETCTDAAGKSWPCGARARAAFRMFLRGRAVDCALPSDLAVKQATAECTLAGHDLGEWLAETGWARATPDSPYAAQVEAARKAGLGIFGMAPAAVPLPDPAPVSGISEPG